MYHCGVKTFPAILIVALLGVLQFTCGAESRPWKAGDPLLKPAPADHSPFLLKAEDAARGKFPELFQGKFTGTIGLYVDLDVEGNVLSMDKVTFPQGPINDENLSMEQRDAAMEIALHDVYRRAGAQGSKFLGWFGSKRADGLYLFYRVLKWRLDPMRTAARVRSAVAERYPDFHAPRLLERNRDDSKNALVTVAMNDDGTINDAVLVENASEEDLTDRKMFDRFRALGLKPDQLAYRGRTTNQGDFQDKNLTSPLLVIQYAWPRRDSDPPDEMLVTIDVFERISLLHLQEQQSHPPDEEFLRRYFSSVWKTGLPGNSAGVWLLLARTGEVVDAGTTHARDIGAAEHDVHARYSGIKTSEASISGAKIPSGSTIPMHYIWIASDSPIVPKARVKAN